MIAPVTELLSAFVDIFLPPHEDVVRARALSERDLAHLLEPRTAGAEWIFVLFPYRDPRIRALIRAVKYHAETKALALVGAILGEYVFETIAEKKLFSGWEHPLLVPVPASRERQRARGYNQAERIALAALPALGSAAEFSPNALVREDRKSQVTMERSKRKENIRDAFRVPDVSLVKSRAVILIDDVVESGSTLADARRALRAAGAKSVMGIALAH